MYFFIHYLDGSRDRVVIETNGFRIVGYKADDIGNGRNAVYKADTILAAIPSTYVQAFADWLKVLASAEPPMQIAQAIATWASGDMTSAEELLRSSLDRCRHAKTARITLGLIADEIDIDRLAEELSR